MSSEVQAFKVDVFASDFELEVMNIDTWMDS